VSLYALSAIGTDRPGIVAAITAELLELEGNVEDSQMAILRGHFAVMLIVAVPDEVPQSDLEGRLDRVRTELGLAAVAVSPVEQVGGGPVAGHVLSVYGSDHPGIVASVSSLLAERGISITGLETRLGGGAEQPVYVMLMEIALGDADAADLEGSLESLGREEGLEVSLRALDAGAL
jgi:glycine cleavage system transcriptional repressor